MSQLAHQSSYGGFCPPSIQCEELPCRTLDTDRLIDNGLKDLYVFPYTSSGESTLTVSLDQVELCTIQSLNWFLLDS